MKLGCENIVVSKCGDKVIPVICYSGDHALLLGLHIVAVDKIETAIVGHVFPQWMRKGLTYLVLTHVGHF